MTGEGVERRSRLESVAGPSLEVARATPYPRAEVPRSTVETMATVATLFTPARMVHILA